MRRTSSRDASAVGVAGVGEHAAEVQPLERGDTFAEVCDLGARLEAGAVEAGVDLDQDRNAHSVLGRRVRESAGILETIDADGHAAELLQRGGARPLAAAGHFVGDEDVAYALVEVGFGLVQFRDGNAGGAGGKLALGDAGGLVRLRVRTQVDAGVGRYPGHVSDVALQAVEVDEDGGSVQSVELGAERSRGHRPPARGSKASRRPSPA